MARYWGHHLVLDIGGCSREAISNEDTIRAWGTELIKAIDMVAHGQPYVEYFDHEDPKLAGITFFQMILTSNLTAHFCENSREGYLDIFSCKDFNVDDAIQVTKKYFSPTEVIMRDLYRGGEFKEKI